MHPGAEDVYGTHVPAFSVDMRLLMQEIDEYLAFWAVVGE